MSIRGGGRPRDGDRGRDHARRTPTMPVWRASDGRGGPPVGQRRRDPEHPGGGLPGLLRFILFAGILGAVVIVAGLTALRPLVRAAIVGYAWDNTGSLKVDFVADFVREDLGDLLTTAPGTDDSEIVFEVLPGDTPELLAPRLLDGGFIIDERAFIFTAIEAELRPALKAGSFLLRHDMTPSEVVEALVRARVVITTEEFLVREGIRLEQITAKLQTVATGVDPAEFYDLVKRPPAALLGDYPWLAGIPEGASLEGFLYPATYTLITSTNGGPFVVTDAEGLVRMMLDRFAEAVGSARMTVAEERGLSFYQIVTLASIVEREAVLDEERALIAGVYQNRIDGVNGTAKILNADPTVIWAADSDKLAALPFEDWDTFFFWDITDLGPLGDVRVSEPLAGYQTYRVGGLIPGPICSPSVASIDAALSPDTAEEYLYFVAIPEGAGAHAFAKTLAEHNANLKKYGYR